MSVKNRNIPARIAPFGGARFSSNDAMRELDKRSRIDSPDGSLETWLDQAGYHAEVVPLAPVVSWDSDAETWAIKVPPLVNGDPAESWTGTADNRYSLLMAYSGGILKFKKHSAEYTVTFGVDIATKTWLKWKASVADATATSDAATLGDVSEHGYQCPTFRHRIFSIVLRTDGTWQTDWRAKTGPQQVTSPARPIDGAYFTYDPTSRALTLRNIMQTTGIAHDGVCIIPAGTTDGVVVYGHGTSSTYVIGSAASIYLLDQINDPPDHTILTNYWVVATITTDSGGVCTDFTDQCRHFQWRPDGQGVTGTTAAIALDSGGTLTLDILDGRITALNY